MLGLSVGDPHPGALLRLALVLAALAASGCEERPAGETVVLVAGGDAARGRDLIRSRGCHGCHTVPGVVGADGLVGPPLIHWSKRGYIAGRLPNTPENLVRWITSPQTIAPGTAMPDLELDAQEVRDIAAYLFTLR
jgi:cytochrome c